MMFLEGNFQEITSDAGIPVTLGITNTNWNPPRFATPLSLVEGGCQ